MITSIEQVNEQFFEILHKIGKDLSVPIRYAKLSSYDYAEEEENQLYPCVVLQEYTPKISEDWFVDYHRYCDGYSIDGLTAYLITRPVYLEFRYDVSIASKSYKEFTKLKDSMLQLSLAPCFYFNKKLSGEDMVGDLVPYKVIPTDIPRVDGIRETNYEFTLKVWLHCIEPEQVDIIQKIIIDLQQKEI